MHNLLQTIFGRRSDWPLISLIASVLFLYIWLLPKVSPTERWFQYQTWTTYSFVLISTGNINNKRVTIMFRMSMWLRRLDIEWIWIIFVCHVCYLGWKYQRNLLKKLISRKCRITSTWSNQQVRKTLAGGGGGELHCIRIQRLINSFTSATFFVECRTHSVK